MEESDNMLLEQIAARDGKALEIRYDRHAHRIHGLIRRIVGDRGAAEAIVVETFWQVCQQAGGNANRSAQRVSMS